MIVYIVAGAVVCGLIGLGTGYLTLRFRGVYFAIATLALAVVFQTLFNNWDYVGGAKGTYILTPEPPLFFSSYVKFLFFVMLLMALFAIVVSRYIAHSKFGRGLAAVRDDEVAAECMGVPTLRLKLISTTVMGVLMGMAGAPYPFYVTYRRPAVGLLAGHRRQRHRHADDRRHRLLVRPGDRRPPARHGAGGDLGHHLLRAQRVPGRRGAGQLRRPGAERARRPVHEPAREGDEPCLSASSPSRSLTKRFGGFVALNAVDLHLDAGERLGLIGPNGSGKTTMINCISGALFCDGGSDHLQGRRHHPARRPPAHAPRHRAQLPDPAPVPLHDRAAEPADPDGIRRPHATAAAPARPRRARSSTSSASATRADANSGRLTQVDMRKLELARALAAKPQLLISDEAMAGLSSSEVDEILDILFKLNARGVAVIMIEHIMRAVLRFSERIIVLDAGRKIAEGTPAEIVKDPEVEKAYLGV